MLLPNLDFWGERRLFRAGFYPEEESDDIPISLFKIRTIFLLKLVNKPY